MYNIVRYDEYLGQFVPETGTNGKFLRFDTYDAAAEALLGCIRGQPAEMYKVEYVTIRRKRRRNG